MFCAFKLCLLLQYATLQTNHYYRDDGTLRCRIRRQHTDPVVCNVVLHIINLTKYTQLVVCWGRQNEIDDCRWICLSVASFSLSARVSQNGHPSNTRLLMLYIFLASFFVFSLSCVLFRRLFRYFFFILFLYYLGRDVCVFSISKSLNWIGEITTTYLSLVAAAAVVV